jgi:hypothetical protein
VGGQGHAPAILPSGKETQYPLQKRLGELRGRSGRARKIRPHRHLMCGQSSLWRVAIPTELPRPTVETFTPNVSCKFFCVSHRACFYFHYIFQKIHFVIYKKGVRAYKHVQNINKQVIVTAYRWHLGAETCSPLHVLLILLVKKRYF